MPGSPEISLTVIKFSYARYRGIYDIYAREGGWGERKKGGESEMGLKRPGG